MLSLLPGYAPKVKDFAEQRAINEKGKKEARLSLRELDSMFREWVLEEYHERVHSETKAKPYERWLESGILSALPHRVEQ